MYTKIVHSGHIYEIYQFEKEPIVSTRPRAFGSRKRRVGFVTRSLENLKRSRLSFIRIVRTNLASDECPSLVTLTMRDVVGIELGYSCLKGFISDLRRVAGTEFKYIAVPEFQKRGSVHFHILFWGLPQEVVLYERRNRYLQNLWALGYVDCVSTDGSAKLAGYLGKYMSKSMQDYRIAGQKAYSCSRNVMRPVSYTSSNFASIPDSFWSQENTVLTERTFGTQWLGECHYQLVQTK